MKASKRAFVVSELKYAKKDRKHSGGNRGGNIYFSYLTKKYNDIVRREGKQECRDYMAD